jgi:hypothetical protein
MNSSIIINNYRSISRSILLLILTLLFNGIGCKPDEIQKCNDIVEYSPIMKDYFLFNDSSTWIYKDSISGILDTVISTNYLKNIIWPFKETGSKNCPCYETYYYRINSKFQETQVIQLDVIPQNNPVNYDKLFFEFEHGILRTQTNIWFPRFWGIGRDSIYHETPIESGLIYKFDSIYINSRKYYNVLILYYPKIEYSDNVKMIYYSKNIGVIKYIDLMDRVWELESYHIKQ